MVSSIDCCGRDFAMKKRRQFIKETIGLLTGLGLFFSPLAAGVRLVWAKAKKIVLPKDTRMETLIGKNPANLDTRHLDLTPSEKFETMGLDNHQVNLENWQLEINGRVKRSVKLKYSKLTSMPSIKKNVLLICPGFFAYHAGWEGISVAKLLQLAQVNSDATHVTFSGPDGTNEKSEQFPLEDILTDKVFLAYRVNDKVLPRKHGFPLRLVADGYYGGKWVKYVYKVTAHK